MPYVQLPESAVKTRQLIDKLLEEKEGEFPARGQLKRLAKMFIPDPYNPVSYIMPIGGLTRQEALSSFAKVVKENPSLNPAFKAGEVRRAAEFLYSLPKKYLEPLKKIRAISKGPGAYLPGGEGGPTIDIGSTTSHPYRTLTHELNHMIQEVERPRVYKDIYPSGTSPSMPKMEMLTDWMAQHQQQALGHERVGEFPWTHAGLPKVVKEEEKQVWETTFKNLRVPDLYKAVGRYIDDLLWEFAPEEKLVPTEELGPEWEKTSPGVFIKKQPWK